MPSFCRPHSTCKICFEPPSQKPHNPPDPNAYLNVLHTVYVVHEADEVDQPFSIHVL